jgi:succinate-acetate transporter protein
MHREPPGFNLTLLFLSIAFVLLAVSLFTESAIVSTVGGIAAIISSVIAATASFTDLHKRAGSKYQHVNSSFVMIHLNLQSSRLRHLVSSFCLL